MYLRFARMTLMIFQENDEFIYLFFDLEIDLSGCYIPGLERKSLAMINPGKNNFHSITACCTYRNNSKNHKDLQERQKIKIKYKNTGSNMWYAK